MSDDELTTRLVNARVIYEGTHGMTLSELADVTGMHRRTLSGHRNAGQWAKTVMTGQTPEAAAAVEWFAKAKSATVKSDAESKAAAAVADSNIPDLAKPLLEEEISIMLERHKQEWLAPRAMSAEAVKLRNSNPVAAWERSKLAKITAETLDIVQKAERRAWSIDNEDSPQGAVVVIDRGE